MGYAVSVKPLMWTVKGCSQVFDVTPKEVPAKVVQLSNVRSIPGRKEKTMVYQLESPDINTVINYCKELCASDKIEVYDFGEKKDRF